MRRLLCAVFGHALPRGLTRSMVIFYCCARCNERVPGDFHASRRKRGSPAAIVIRREALITAIKGTKK